MWKTELFPNQIVLNQNHLEYLILNEMDMEKRMFLGLFSFVILLFLVSCKGNVKEATTVLDLSKEHVLSSEILTADEQAKLTPQAVLDTLKKGNTEFINDNLTIRNNTQRVRDAAIGQYPMAVILSCLDSRVPVEDIFHRGIGDLFVARVAGNVVDTDILGSLEYACKVSGSKLIVVLGHEHCGAIKSAIDDVKLGSITSILEKISPAVETAKKRFDGDKTSKNPKFIEAVCEDNVYLGIEKVRKSPILKEMEDNGEIMIVGGVYDMKTGQVHFI